MNELHNHASASTPDAICSVLCATEPPIFTYPSAEIRKESLKKYSAYSCAELEKALTGSMAPEVVGDVLATYGMKLMAEDIDGAVKVLTCAAEKYMNIFATTTLGTLYQVGTAEALKSLPDAKNTHPIQPDLAQALYWFTVTLLLDTQEHMGFGDPMTAGGWNTIAAIDTLGNGPSLTEEERATANTRASEFVSKRYPAVLEGGKDA